VKVQRVRKPGKPDMLLDSGMMQDIKRSRIQSLVWNYDRAIAEAEVVWGADRLPYLVGEDLRLKWWRNVEALNKAIFENDVEQVEIAVPRMIKGIAVLIEQATAAGQKPIEPDVWETTMGDKVLRVVRSWPEHAAPVDKRPNVVTYSLEEIARILQAREMSVVNSVKETWPGASVQRVKSPTDAELDDEIPF